MRTERYSYMRYHGIWDMNELYDLQTDPGQMRNLVGEVTPLSSAEVLLRST